jgi:Fic family protein
VDIRERLLDEMKNGVKGGLYHMTQIGFAYNSNRIEGSRLSEDQTRYIFETNTVDVAGGGAVNVDDIIETVNHFACFDYMLGYANTPLDEKTIKELHGILKRGTSQARLDWFNVGEYKAVPNTVGGKETALPENTEARMTALLDEYGQHRKHGFEDIVEFHYKFESIHPFQDGNGRVGRMIMFKECLNNDVMPFIIDERHKMYYYRGLSEYAKEPGYLRETCASAQDKYAETVRYFTKKKSIAEKVDDFKNGNDGLSGVPPKPRKPKGPER